MSSRSYDKIIEDLFSRHPSVQNKGFTTGAYKPGLEAMRKLDSKLGSPWKRYKCIHVAGTNGKGSVCSMLASCLAANGYKVGLYTSPHLVDFRERIKIIDSSGYQLISRNFVMKFILCNDLDGYSFFEITTAMAFSYFADQKVDFAIIETGLGGRLDSTNIITPVLSIITSIGLDHCALLGNTLADIAKEKAGIIKKGVPVLIGEYEYETAEVFEKKAEELECQCEILAEKDLLDIELTEKIAEQNTPKENIIFGPCVFRNYCIAARVIKNLGENLNYEALTYFASRTGLRGRWEIVQRSNPMIICDIGHNAAALEPIFERLTYKPKPLYIVYGVMADKDYSSIRRLMPQDAKYYAVAPHSERALSVEKLATVLEGLDFVCADSVVQGAEMAIADASQVPDSVVFIGGSNFVVAEYLENIQKDRHTQSLYF